MKAYLNVSSANIYREPTFHTEIDTQVVLGERLQVMNSKGDFKQVTCEDGYVGWINRHQLCENNLLEKLERKRISADYVKFYTLADDKSQVLRDGMAGGYVYVKNSSDNWLEVFLPDGTNAWVEDKHFAAPQKLTRENLIEFVKRFRGVPYYWGGKTAKGFDCSGLTQFAHKMFGINIRRDAWMQFEDAKAVSENPLDGQPGDMMFFAESDTKITHVGFCLGDGMLLHARGMVRVNSLNEGHKLFSMDLKQHFVAVKSFL